MITIFSLGDIVCYGHELNECIINIGSLGQPRDGDNLASFAIYDSFNGSIEIRKVDYNYETTANKIIDAGLPRRLAKRLTKMSGKAHDFSRGMKAISLF